MAKKKGQRRNVKRFTGPEEPKAKRIEKKTSIVEKAPMQKRIKENNDGFGILKGVALVILLLIIGSAILFNRAGGRDAMRGDKAPGEACEKTEECARGTICYQYGDAHSQCYETCSKSDPCNPTHTCVTAAHQKRRKGLRLREICVENGQI